MIAKIAQKLQRHRALTIVTFIILFGASVVFIGRGAYSNNILDMLPVKDRVISKYFQFLSLFDIMDRIVFEVSVEDSTKSFDQLAVVTQAIISKLKENDLLQFQQEITAKDFFQLRNFLIGQWPNLFTQKDSMWVSKRLSEDSLYARFDRVASGLFTFSTEASDAFLLQHDPFGIAQYSLTKLSAFKPADNIIIEDGFITNSRRNRILFFASFINSKKDDTNERKAQGIIKAAEKYAGANGFKLTWMGGLRASRDNNEMIKRDIHLTLPVAIIIILAICMLAYRKPYFGFLTFIPTTLGIAFTLAVFSNFGRLSIIIIGFGAALLGITVDYAIHFLFHIDDAPQDKNPVKTLTGPIFASAFTTAGAFLVLVAARIPGLSQLGVVTATGIVLVAFLSLTLLPVFTEFSRKPSLHKQRIKLSLFFHHFYTNRFDRKLLLPLIIITGIAIFFIPKLSFDGDPDNLNGMKPETIAAEQSLEQNWIGVGSSAYLVVSDTSCEAACRKAEQALGPLVDSLISLKLIKPASLFTLLLPQKEIQKRNKLRWRQTFAPDIISKMRKVIALVASKYKLEPDVFYRYLSDISSSEPYKFVKYEDFPLSFKKGILSNYLRNTDSLWYANVPVFMTTGSAWKDVDEIARHYDVLAVNSEVLGMRVVTIIKAGFLKCIIYIPFVILCILLIMLRNLRYTITALIPIFSAAGITLGIMAAFNLPVNIVSLMICAFIFGLGIDYALLMVYMCRKGVTEGEDFTPHGAASVTIAACTTLAGLGILAIARHPVLSVLGKVGMIGIISSYVCSVIFVPILAGSGNKNHRKGSDK